jgi:large conductance mechanosensitive channel
MKGFKNFLLQGDLIVIAVGLVVALAFSTLIKAFTDNIITPLVNSASGTGGKALGWTVNGHVVNVGAFISALIYFIVFLGIVYLFLVVPYRAYMAKRGTTVFGSPPATKSCSKCLSADLPVAATRCLHCAADLTTGSAS